MTALLMIGAFALLMFVVGRAWPEPNGTGIRWFDRHASGGHTSPSIDTTMPVVFAGAYRTNAHRFEPAIIQAPKHRHTSPGFCRRCGWKVGSNRPGRVPSLEQAYCQSNYEHRWSSQ